MLTVTSAGGKTRLALVVVGALALHLILFTYNSLTLTRLFSPDSMNYVDVARNIAAGKGIVQSALGFNQPFLFQADSPLLTPLVTHPPLFPVLIALLGRSGLAESDAALVIPAISYAGLLLLAYRLSRDLFGEAPALLSVLFLLVFAPLVRASRTAWTESPGIFFLLLSLWFLVRSRRANESGHAGMEVWLAGLSAGLAFGLRYAFFTLPPVGVFYLAIEGRDRHRLLRTLFLYLLGAGVPIVLVSGHNLFAAGYLLPPSLPSDRGFLWNFGDAVSALFGSYLLDDNTERQLVLAAHVLALAVLALVVKRRGQELLGIFISGNRYLLTVWVLSYMFLIVLLRTVSQFDLDARTMLPASTGLLLLIAPLLVQAMPAWLASRNVIGGALILSALALSATELQAAASQPRLSLAGEIARSDRLSWTAQHTTERDLVIGDDTMDIPFYFPGRTAVSFSPYPYTIHLTYSTLRDYVNHNCPLYQHVYLVLRSDPGWPQSSLLYYFGQFIAELKAGMVAAYPEIHPLYYSADADVFEVSCPV